MNSPSSTPAAPPCPPGAESAPGTRWWQPGIVPYTGWEMTIMRLAFAWLLFTSMGWDTTRYTTQPHPNGLAHWVDLTWLAHHPPGVFWQGITAAGLVLYGFGVLPFLGLFPALFFAVLTGTLANSQGAINHSLQLVTMIALAQTLCYAWSGWRSKVHRVLKPSLDAHRLAIHASLVVIASSYVVSGLVKWIASDGLWIWRAPYLSVQLLKSNWNDYYNSLAPLSPSLESWTNLLVAHPWFARAFFGTGLLIETGAFVLLLGRRWALATGLAIVGLHLGISWVMKLRFETHIAVAVIFLINLPVWIVALWSWIKVRRQGSATTPRSS